jgi:hypothetical protein
MVKLQDSIKEKRQNNGVRASQKNQTTVITRGIKKAIGLKRQRSHY